MLTVALLASTILWAQPKDLRPFLEQYCLDCHSGKTQEGNLNLESLDFEYDQRKSLDKWILIHDKVHSGEMPPKKKQRPDGQELATFLKPLAATLKQADRERVEIAGRASIRRLNRFEFENSLRERLHAPWLLIADMLPEDGTAHLFNKVGERRDVSHVQITKF